MRSLTWTAAPCDAATSPMLYRAFASWSGELLRAREAASTLDGDNFAAAVTAALSPSRAATSSALILRERDPLKRLADLQGERVVSLLAW